MNAIAHNSRCGDQDGSLAIDQQHGQSWSMYQGDCCDLMAVLPDASIHYSIFSPPFSSLYVYSDSERDMGNAKDDAEFFEHFEWLIAGLFRVVADGRLVSIHCSNLPSMKQHQGYIGLRDFRGEIIRSMVSGGWIYHSEVCIWKDPVLQMQRTKSIGLLHKQMAKDSAMSRQGLPDYVVTFRKPGINPDPIAGKLDRWHGDDSLHSKGDRSIDIWQRYASPVWMDINQSNTLNVRAARDGNDERHICPLQLDVIARCLELWTNPKDIVLSPFAGIGSEGYVSVGLHRRFIGFELKTSYFIQACKNLADAERESEQPMLFDVRKYAEWGGLCGPSVEVSKQESEMSHGYDSVVDRCDDVSADA